MDAPSLVSAWDALVQQLGCVFTEPTARTWQPIALGWVLNRGPATMTAIFRTLGDTADRHWTGYEKFFYHAAWCLSTLCAVLLQRVVYPLLREAAQGQASQVVADLAIDDTRAGRSGRHVAHASWFKDASATGLGHRGTVIHWAHNWLVGAITLRLPAWPLLRWVLPVLFTLYRKRTDCHRDHPFRTRQQLAGQMIQQAAEALPKVRWRVVADGQYASRDVVRALPQNVNLVSRIRRDAAIYALPKARRRGQRGQPAKKGPRLPTPRQLAARRKVGWQKITVFKQGRSVERLVLGITCLWYHVCRDQPIRLVLVRDPASREADDFFFCTSATVPDAEIVQRYYDRWGVEEAIQEAKQCLGFETTQGWCSQTVNRQAPLAMVLVTLVKAWYARCALREPRLRPASLPWYPHKVQPSLADMLAALRKVLWQHRITLTSRSWPRVRRLFQTVSFALSGAA
jgi:hypothetical protein